MPPKRRKLEKNEGEKGYEVIRTTTTVRPKPGSGFMVSYYVTAWIVSHEKMRFTQEHFNYLTEQTERDCCITNKVMNPMCICYTCAENKPRKEIVEPVATEGPALLKLLMAFFSNMNGVDWNVHCCAVDYTEYYGWKRSNQRRL